MDDRWTMLVSCQIRGAEPLYLCVSARQRGQLLSGDSLANRIVTGREVTVWTDRRLSDDCD